MKEGRKPKYPEKTRWQARKADVLTVTLRAAWYDDRDQ